MFIMTKYLKNNANLVFVILGRACNNKCIYCMQHDIITNQVNVKVNPKVIDFLTELGSQRDENDDPLRIQFFGGEPLIYFESLKHIVKELSKKKHFFSF